MRNDETNENQPSNESGPGEPTDQEVADLLNEETGRLRNEAAEASLQLLAVLGAYHGDVTIAYRAEVAKATVRVLLALASVRMCIEAATGEMTDGQRMAFLTRLVGLAFGIEDPEPVIAELFRESLAA